MVNFQNMKNQEPRDFPVVEDATLGTSLQRRRMTREGSVAGKASPAGSGGRWPV